MATVPVLAILFAGCGSRGGADDTDFRNLRPASERMDWIDKQSRLDPAIRNAIAMGDLVPGMTVEQVRVLYREEPTFKRVSGFSAPGETPDETWYWHLYQNMAGRPVPFTYFVMFRNGRTVSSGVQERHISPPK